MKQRQQSSTAHPINFFMVLSSDHVSPATGKTVTVNLSKDGGAFAAASGAVTEIGNGWYSLAGNATDRNTLGELCIRASATGCDDTPDKYIVVPWDPFAAHNMGLDALPAVVAAASGGLPTVGTGAGQINPDGSGNVPVAMGESLPGSPTAGTVGEALKFADTRLDAAVSSRMATFTLPTNFSSLVIDASGRVDVSKVLGAAINALISGRLDVSVGAFQAGLVPTNFASLLIDGSGRVTLLGSVQKNTALSGFPFLMTDSTTHAPKTGVTVTATRSIDGAAFAACANAPTETGNGWYQINLAASDLNGRVIALRFTGASADDRDLFIITQG